MKSCRIKQITIIIMLSVLLTMVCSCRKDKKGENNEASTLVTSDSVGTGSVDMENGNIATGGNYISTGSNLLPENAIITAAEDEAQDIDDSYEVKLFSDRMFWGEWVRLYSQEDNGNETNERIEIESEGLDFSIDCFPQSFYLGTLENWGLSSEEKYAKEYDCGTYGILGFNGEIITKDNDTVMEYNIANLSAFDRPKGDYSFDCVYHVKDDTLAFGIMEPNPDAKKGDSIPLTEINYRFKWTGAYLTLSFGDKSMVYTPTFYKNNNNKIEIDNTTRIAGTESDNPLADLILTDRDSKIEYKYDVPLTIQSLNQKEGKFELIDALGKVHSIEIYYAGKTVTIKENDSLTILKNGAASPFTRTEYVAMAAGDPKYSSGSFMGESFLGEKVKDLEAEGNYSLEADTGFLVQSTQIVKFDGTLNGNTIHYKAINTYGQTVPLAECTICAEQIDKKSGNINILADVIGSTVEQYSIGESDYLTVKKYPEDIYSADKKRIIFKYSKHQLISYNPFSNSPYGYPVIDHSFEKEIVFLFEDDILTSFSFDMPDYLYGGLQNNMDQSDLMGMDESQMDNAFNIRDSVLARLIDAFDTSGVSVDIEPGSGLVRMSNDILFDTNKFDVKPEGVEYINQVLGVISGVVLDSDIRDCIDKIEIGGHCDVRGDYESNYILSVKRAEAVKNSFITSSTGLSDAQKSQLSDLLITEGYSFSSPIFNEQGQPDDDKSRRVEVKIYINTNTTAPTGSANVSDNSIRNDINSTPSYAGSISGSTYKNEVFGYSFDSPDGWSFAKEDFLFEANGNRNIQKAFDDKQDVYIMYAEDGSGTDATVSIVIDLSSVNGDFDSESGQKVFIEYFHEAFTKTYTDRKDLTYKLSEIKFCGTNRYVSEMEYKTDEGIKLYHKVIYIIKNGMMNIVQVISPDKDRCNKILDQFH